ncbi:MAG: hypothetical protein COY81_00485 [Candidatus Pacebacteria bacterium CG_4_10_14_0_8_um_filter_43_12]|uniref:Uncharacterized protein n=2 Tax=Candidatus Roizmaniibacteriota TaxID=1752723 RepID=A0A2M8F501_9BACT|nr:MAG: hypothetical protein COY81_00485 [Candidatus Pacebacteria bacterium CG_4_10_14_0_8_um_filter_43_12]PIZ79480.1 MAG: hypothetical protein COY01_00975 [Candidatus Pacebacteria bacterium CG_4_10_14_0_2_um_filter_40_20]PJC34358.1 MAG: hypothetical protein CO051_00070 [Candidatus Roizmanbacteria bacterium CG_4_9_14_0_2_um_filter_39_13]PJE61633.1 MAG: hypothetical protein COU87_03550 [Candidatus Roizmanbacteria bacterium CG10_big_fil_rev_8_21_14_0_10_39_12]
MTKLQAIEIVFYDKRNTFIGLLAATFFGTFFVLGTGMVTFFPEGPFIEFNLLRLSTLFALVVLSGLVVPMQLFAIRKAKSGLKTSASGLGGLMTGIATMSCCAPLLLPALLSFIGFSGTQLLFFNTTIRQYVLPLSLFSVALLSLSLLLVSRSVVASCKIDVRRTV